MVLLVVKVQRKVQVAGGVLWSELARNQTISLSLSAIILWESMMPQDKSCLPELLTIVVNCKAA